MAASLRLPPPLSSLRRLLSCFTRSPSSTIVTSRSFTSSGLAEESIAYRRSMLRRPATVRRMDACQNSCSFIGTVVYPVKRFEWRTDLPDGTYTVLEVSGESESSSSFRILIVMRDNLAEISLQYLKPHDFIYVHGILSSYYQGDENGTSQVCYKVSVGVLNYVQQRNQNISSQQHDCSRIEEITGPTSAALDGQGASSSSVLDPEEERRNRLHLWGVYFANPCEWWDNRKGKKNLRSPDFKHKDTGETLRIRPDDPPWIQKQLQLNDSKMVTGYQRRRPRLGHKWDL